MAVAAVAAETSRTASGACGGEAGLLHLHKERTDEDERKEMGRSEEVWRR
jgi:hypothetical protein